MPPEAKEIDVLKQTVLREHLNALSQTPAPEKSSGVFTLDRGYIDDQNNATPLGEQYLLLLDNGLIDDKGELTEDGKLYSKTQKESVYGSPDDYIKREKLGLNQLEKDATKVGFGDSMLSMGKQFFTESIPAMFEFTSPNARLDPLQFINDASTLVKSSLLSLEPLATGTISKIADASLAFQNADADEKETASLLLKQEYERKRYDYDSITGADLLTALSGGSTVPNQMRDLLIKQKGEENVTRQEQAVGLVGSLVDPTILASMGSTTIAKAASQTVTRSLLNAEKQALKFSVLSTEQAGIRSQMAALESALSRAEGVGAKVTEKASAFESVGKTAESIRYKATAARIGDRMQDIKGKLDELAAVDSTISTDLAGLSKKAGVGDALIGINNKIQQFNALPANAIGKTVETIGNGLIKADAWLDDIATKTGIDGIYDALKSIPGLSAGLVLGPAAAIPTIGARILASGPFLESVGKYTKILGKELMQARGSSSYWQRVANNPTISNAQRFLSHRMDELTLGGYLPEVAGNVVKGTAASYPMNLAIEYLQDPYGETKDILDRAAGASLVFGGGFSGVSQMFKGSKETLKAVRIGDELNFTRNLLESQKAGYNSLGKGARRMVSSFAAAFPNLNWEFADGLPSRYDPVTNTVRINPKSNNPLRPLIAHEVGHYISIRNGSIPLIRSMLLGDAETPGILRKTNGELDPEFQRFKDEYDKRTDAGNIERRTLEDIAEEYFIENTVDHMVEMVESGELSKMTGRTQAGRQLRKFIQTTMPRVPILKDFFFRTGGAMQAGNKFVDGNGLLAEGLRELPEAKAMMRNLIRDTAGEASSVPRGKGEKGDAGNRLPVQKGDPIVDSFHSILESDASGQPLLDKDGDHIPLSRATDEARQAAGLVLIEEQIRRVNDGYMPEDGEIKLIPDKGWQGRFISPATINALAAKGILNAKQIAILRNINTATRQNSGTRYMVINHPATIKRRGGKIRYASLEAALRETVPVGFSITKTGNVLVHLMSVDQLHKNVTSRAASKRGQTLYQGNPEAIKQDISAMMDMHATNTKTDKYYQDKYGPKWEEHQRFINTIFGQMTKEQRSINPMFDADKIKDGGVYRTYRLDRISKATKMDGTPIPFNYDYVKVNYFPDGVVDKSEQMPEQSRQMPEGKYDQETAIQNKQVIADRFEGFRPQVGVKGLTYGWQRPSDGKFIKIDQHQFLYRDDNGNQLGDPLAIGYVRIAREGDTLFYDGKPNAKQLKELKDTAIENNLDLQNSTPRYMPEKVDADYMKAVEEGDVEMQQRAVDEAAKAAGYEKRWNFSEDIKIDTNRGAFYTTSSKSAADSWGEGRTGQTRPVFISAKAKAIEGKNILSSSFMTPEMVTKLKSAGFDSASGGRDWKRGDEIAVFSPEQIKLADPITRDDSGNIIPPSKRFNTESKDIRYMPEPIPANYKSSRDDTYLKASLGPDGRMNATRPFKSTEALPTIAMRHDYPLQELVVSKFDKKESIIYAKNKNGEDISFKFDPAMMNEPEFADFDDLYDGKVIQFAMADRHSAVDGDMGGHSFPDLKVNQENILTDQNGKKYKIVWANNAWGPVANMSNKATKFGATSLLTYNMDQHAHDSNTRTVRIFSNEIANSGLSVADQSTILIVQNVALKKSQTSASKKDLRSLIADRNKLNKKLIIDDKLTAGKKVKDATKLSTEDRDALVNSINDLDTSIKREEEFLKESLGAKAATPEETQVDKLFREYQTKRRAYEKNPSSERKKKSMEDSEVNLRQHQKTKGFAAAEKLLPSRELDKFSSTFKGRKSLINAVKTKTAAAKWGKFDAQKISETIGDQLTGDSLHVVGAVELSSDPNFKALYLGDDPKEIARMTPAEQAAAAQLKANPDFVAHEAYLWVMLGPAESKHYFNTNQRSVLDSVPDFIDQYSQLPVKADKKKLNDPESKASEFNIVNTARDQSKIPVIFKAKPKQNDEK